MRSFPDMAASVVEYRFERPLQIGGNRYGRAFV